MKLKRKRKEIKLRLFSVWMWWMGWEVNRSKKEQLINGWLFILRRPVKIELLRPVNPSWPRLTSRAFKYSQYFLLIRAVGHVDEWSRPASNSDYKNKVLYEIHWNVCKKKNKLKNAMLLYLASELRLFKQSAVIGSNFKVKAYKKEGEAKLIIYHSFW